MDDNLKRMPKRAWVLLAAWLLIGYPLSIGPVGGLESRGMLSQPAVHVLTVFYTPLRWLYENCPRTVSAAFDWYLNLWVPGPPSVA